MASEIGEAQTRSRNTSGVEDYNKLLIIIVELFWKSKPKGVKVSYMKWLEGRVESRVRQGTWNPVGSRPDHRPRLNTNWWPIVKQYREGKLKRTPGGEWNRTWNPMFTSRQRALRLDVVLFVERSGELRVWCEVKYYVRYEAEGKPSLKRAKIIVSCSRPETEWPIHEQVEAWVKSSGGPNRYSLKRIRMTCG